MLCCLDASVANDDNYGAIKKKSKRSKKKKTFEEVELRMGSYEHMNGRIPRNTDDSIHSSDTEGTETPDDTRDAQHQEQQEADEDTLPHVDLLQHQVQQLQKERDDYRNRLSWYASSTLKDNNPNIVDLSDPNRPDALGQRAAELYENQWTDAYIYLTDNGMEEKPALGILVDILRTVYRVCKTLASQQMNSLGSQIGFFTGFEQIPPYLLTTVQMYKDERKKNYKKFLPALEKKARKYIKTVRGLGDYFFLEALETCWLLCIQDPPMVLDFACFPGDVFDSKSFRPFTNPGSHVDFLVWPALRLYENGPLLTKGFAQGRRGGIPTHHNVTRRLTADARPDHGSTSYRRQYNSAQLSRISESSQEYQSFQSTTQPSDYSKSSGRSSNRYASTSQRTDDSLSQMSLPGSSQRRRQLDYKEFFKNADFKTTEETDASMTSDQNDTKEPERFVVPGRNKMYNADADATAVDSHPSDPLPKETRHGSENTIQDATLNTERTFVDEETQTSDNGIRSPPTKLYTPVHFQLQHQTESPLQPSRSLSVNERPTPVGQELNIDSSKAQESEKQTELSDGFSSDVTLQDDQENAAYKISEHSPIFDSKTPDADGGARRKEPAQEVDINDNVISKPPLPLEKQLHSQSDINARSKTPSSPDKSTLVGILKTSKRDSGSVGNSPSESKELSAKRDAVRKAKKRTAKRPTPTQSMGSRNSDANSKDTESGNQSKTDSPANKETKRRAESPAPYLTIKVNKIKRLPRRYREDDESDGENKINSQTIYTSGKEIKDSPNPQYTPRNVPSVESSGIRSLDTIVLSRNTLKQSSTDNTPRLTTRTVTSVQSHQINVTARHKTAFEHDSRVSTEEHQHIPGEEQVIDSGGRSTEDDSRLSDRGYISRAITDYTPRHKNLHRSPPVIKQYPAMTPDFSNTLSMKLIPDNSGHGTFILAPKPPPKIPGKVAARLRFVTN